MKTVKRETITREMVDKALTCETPAELVKLAKGEGYEMTEAEADAYLSELADIQLDSGQIKKAAGGGVYGTNNMEVVKCDNHCKWRE